MLARALRAAVGDITDKSHPRIYVDTDFVFTALSGGNHTEVLQRLHSGESYSHGGAFSRHGDDLPAAMLWSAGLLDPLFMVQAHISEVEHELRIRRPSRGPWEGQLGPHLTDDLVQHARQATDAVGQERYLHFVRQCGVPIFVGLELLRLTWQERLVQLMEEGRLRWDQPGLAEEKLIARANRYIDMLSAMPGRAELTRNNYYDGLALASIMAMADDGAKVRFVTQTRAVRDAIYADAALRRRFCGVGIDDDPIDAPDGILRSTHYLAIRAVLGSLQSPLRRMTGAEELSADEWVRFIDRHTGEGGVTPDFAVLLRQYFRDEFLRGVWLSNDAPVIRILREARQRTIQQSDVESIERAGEQVRPSVDESIRTLGETVRSTFAFEHDVAAVRLALATAVHAAPLFRGPNADEELRRADILRDLGLVRWIPSVSDEANARVADWIRCFRAAASLSERGTACSEFGSFIARARSDSEDFWVAIAVLWAVSAYRGVDVMLERRNQVSPLSVPLQLMRLHIQAVELDEDVAVATMCKRVERLLHECGDDDEGRRAKVAAAYLLHEISKAVADRGEQVAMRKRALELVLEVAKQPYRDLLRAFAVDAACYIAVTAGLHVEDEVFDDLRAQRGTSYWHFRFADTLLYNDFLEVKRDLREWSDDGAPLTAEQLETVKRVRDNISRLREELTKYLSVWDRGTIAVHLEEMRRVIQRCSAALRRGVNL